MQIDETGYFTGQLLDIAQRLGVPLAGVEQILAVVQTFDPAGIGARNLAECLALQAKEADRYDPAMARLIANLDYLAKGNIAALEAHLPGRRRGHGGHDPRASRL